MTRRPVLVLLFAACLCGPAAAQAPADIAAQVQRLIVQQANEFRQAQGKESLEPHSKLADAARDFAAFMAKSGRYGHEADGRTPAERASASGFQHCVIAENIAYQYHSEGFTAPVLAEKLMQGWQESPGHRKNLLDPDVTHTGVGIARSSGGRYYAVQLFGRPKDRAIEFSIANRAGTQLRYELDGEQFTLPPRATMTHSQCRTPVLALQMPGVNEPTTLAPRDGDHFTIERDPSGGLRVSKT